MIIPFYRILPRRRKAVSPAVSHLCLKACDENNAAARSGERVGSEAAPRIAMMLSNDYSLPKILASTDTGQRLLVPLLNDGTFTSTCRNVAFVHCPIATHVGWAWREDRLGL